MSRKVPPVEIPDANPFEHDVLDREPIAKHLTSLLRTIEDPFVFSLSSPYGTGKTTFVRMWQQHLEKEGFVTLYYDAWSNDFVDDPLVAFIDEITTRIEGRDELADEKWQKCIAKIKTFANTVAWRTIPVGLKLLTAGLLDANDFDEQVLTEAVQGVSGEAIEQYRSMRDDVQEFRETLTELVEEVQTEGDGNPIILFVDELDRCRPDHAVLLLERIKHFFSIPGITFVLSMEPDQLQHSVKALYGAGFDAKGYLRRFIDLDFSLPKPPIVPFTRLLFRYHGLYDTLEELDKARMGQDTFLTVESIARAGKLGLRQQQKFALRYGIALSMARSHMDMDGRSAAFLSLIVGYRIAFPKQYAELVDGTQRASGLVKAVKSTFLDQPDDQKWRYLRAVEHLDAAASFYDASDENELDIAITESKGMSNGYNSDHGDHAPDGGYKYNALKEIRKLYTLESFKYLIQVAEITGQIDDKVVES